MCLPGNLKKILFLCIISIISSENCKKNEGNSCSDPLGFSKKYSKGANIWSEYISKYEVAQLLEKPCQSNSSFCHYPLIKKDLKIFKEGISQKDINDALEYGTLYQIIDKKLYRDKKCMFPSRCSGIEHFILKIIDKLPDMELLINTKDWPQVPKLGFKRPVFSFSKTEDYLDITYPAWTFWEGGPAISLYPKGLGRWDKHRKSLMAEAKTWPWKKKNNIAFFRGSRTSSERDPLVYLSRKFPDLVNAQYTKNQAWKSDADTLYAPPAEVVSLESHCHYKYLFNYRGVAASFRFKHLFLCKSLVFHVGSEWIEFFYPRLIPWLHYIPVSSQATQEDLRNLILFVKENDDIAEKIAEEGYNFIKDHLRIKDVLSYWKKLLISYAKLLKYKPEKRNDLLQIS